MKNPLKKLRLWTPIQWFAVGMATLLFVAVFYNMKDMFYLFFYREDALIYSLSMAGALVSLPFYLGCIASELGDTGNGSARDKKMLRRVFWLAVFVVVLAAAMAVGLRLVKLQEMYLDGYRNMPEIFAEICLMVTPAMDALMTFVVSWFAFRKRDAMEGPDEMGGADS